MSKNKANGIGVKKNRNVRRRAAKTARKGTLGKETLPKEIKEVEKVANKMASKPRQRKVSKDERPPVAEGKGFRSSQVPVVSKLGDNSIRITHHEYLGQLAGSIDYTVHTYPITISDSSTFPRGSIEATHFQYQKFESFDVYFITACPTLTSGNIAFGINPDPYQPVPINMEDLMSLKTSNANAIWKESSELPNLRGNLDKMQTYLIPSEANPPNSDVEALYSAGNLYVATLGTVGNSGLVVPFVGHLFVRYSVVCSVPNLDPFQDYIGNWLAFSNPVTPGAVNPNEPFGKLMKPQGISGLFFDLHTVQVDTATTAIVYDSVSPTAQTFGWLFKVSQDITDLVIGTAIGDTFTVFSGAAGWFWLNGNRIIPGSVFNNSSAGPNDVIVCLTQVNFSSGNAGGISAGNTLGIPPRFYGYNMIGFQVSATSITNASLMMLPYRFEWVDTFRFLDQAVAQTDHYDPLKLLGLVPGANKQLFSKIISRVNTHAKYPAVQHVNAPDQRLPWIKQNSSKSLEVRRRSPQVECKPLVVTPMRRRMDDGPACPDYYFPTIDDLDLPFGQDKRSSLEYVVDSLGNLKLKPDDQSEKLVSDLDKVELKNYYDTLLALLPIGVTKGDVQYFVNHGFEQPAGHVIKCSDCTAKFQTQVTLLQASKNGEEKGLLKTITDILGIVEGLGILV